MYCEQSKVKKHLFTTQEKAEQYMKNIIERARTFDGALPQRVYYCESCQGWHMTSKTHILQKYIDDGSAVLEPTPVILEEVPSQMIMHEIKLRGLRNAYANWEKKCAQCVALIERRNYPMVQQMLAKLIWNRIHKRLSMYERLYYTDWRKRLINMTFNIQRRLNNCMDGKKLQKPKLSVNVCTVQECEDAKAGSFNSCDLLDKLNHESLMLRFCFIRCISAECNTADNAPFYKLAKKEVNKTEKYLQNEMHNIRTALTGFSSEISSLSLILRRYIEVQECIADMIERVGKENELLVEKLNTFHLVLTKRIKMLCPVTIVTI